MLTETEVEALRPVRYERKVWDGRGLYLLVTPKGGRCWRYAIVSHEVVYESWILARSTRTQLTTADNRAG